MPGGIPVATFAIGKPGAVNAGLFAVAILAVKDARLREALKRYREDQSRKVLEVGDPRGGARKA
jgi:5-(carboxyamino)imidazole ribonucleotide mutase